MLACQVLRRAPAELNELGEVRNDFYPTLAQEKVLFELPDEPNSLSLLRLAASPNPAVAASDFERAGKLFGLRR